MESDSINGPEEPLDDGLYIPLQRVTNIASQLRITKPTNELDDDIDSPSSESETDSDSDNQLKAKKPKVKRTLKSMPSTDSKQKNYNIWAHVQEDVLTESLGGCGVSQDICDKSRNVESYDYRRGYAMSNNLNNQRTNQLQHRLRRFSSESTDGNAGRKLSSDNDSADSTFSRQRSFSDCKRHEKPFRKYTNKRKFKDRNNFNIRHGGRLNTNDENNSDGNFGQKNLLDLTTTSEHSEEQVANDIASKLYEPKDCLILRAVKTIGKDKCIQIFNEVQRIEKEGGMAIMGGTRRRTPGGVFIFLMKHDDSITKEQEKEIFIEDRKIANKKKKLSTKKKRKEDYKNFQQLMQQDKDLPRLLSRTEAAEEMLSVSNTCKSDLDGNEESVVTNPPPSPVTDGGRENSSDMDMFQTNTALPNRKLSTEESLLNADQSNLVDLNYGDAMDLF